MYFSDLLPLSLPPQVPEILRSLQVSVQAVLVYSPYDTDWFEEGVDLVTVIQLRYVHVLHVYLYMYI